MRGALVSSGERRCMMVGCLGADGWRCVALSVGELLCVVVSGGEWWCVAVCYYVWLCAVMCDGVRSCALTCGVMWF